MDGGLDRRLEEVVGVAPVGRGQVPRQPAVHRQDAEEILAQLDGGSEEVFLGGSRLKNFTETVERARGSKPLGATN